MATYSFLENFVELVKAGKKTQTIRRMRKYPPEPGETMVFKSGGVPFGEGTITRVFPVRFFAGNKALIMYQGRILTDAQERRFARLDGLNPEDLKKFLRRYSADKDDWNEFLVIRWKDFRPVRV